MTEDTVTVIFWNVWFFTQDGRRDDGQKLLARLETLISHYHPDVLGLNEVLIRRDNNSSGVISYLTAQGFHCHFAPLSPINENWMIGNLLASRRKLLKVQDHVLGPDTQAARRSYAGYSVKAIEAEIVYGKTHVTFLLNYLSSLLPMDWKTHLVHRRSYEKLVNTIKNHNLIIGGDFNETKYMLPWLRLSKKFTRKTGTLFKPTWRLNGKKRYLASANYDNLVYNHTGDLVLHTFKVLDRSPSDHAPLLGIFKIKGS